MSETVIDLSGIWILIGGVLLYIFLVRKFAKDKSKSIFWVLPVFIGVFIYTSYRDGEKVRKVKELNIKVSGLVTYIVEGNWNGYGIIGVDILQSNKKELRQPRDIDDGYIGRIEKGKGEFYLASAGYYMVSDTLELDTKNGIYNRRTSRGIDSVSWR